MLEMHLKQSGFTYSACGPFTKNKERIKKLKKKKEGTYIYQNEQDNAFFQHDRAYGGFKDLNRTAAADKVLRDKAFIIAKNIKPDGYQRGLASMIYKCFGKKVSGGRVKNEIISNRELTEELHKPIIKDLYFYYVLLTFIANMHGLFN